MYPPCKQPCITFIAEWTQAKFKRIAPVSKQQQDDLDAGPAPQFQLVSKTEVITGKCDRKPLLRNGEPLADVNRFTYMGSAISKDGCCSFDIKNRLVKAWGAFQVTAMLYDYFSNALKRQNKTYRWTIAREAKTQKIKTQDLEIMTANISGWRRLLSACVSDSTVRE